MTSQTDPITRAGAVLTIDLDALAANYTSLAERSAPSECAAVVKADAYGLGLAEVAPVLARAGARTFFVATLDEGLALRALLPEARIGVLDGLMPGTEAEFEAAALTPVLNDLGQIERWRARAGADGRTRPAFVQIDTGMNRLGLSRADVDLLEAEPGHLDGLEVAAFMSHLACADTVDHPMTASQIAAFMAALYRLPEAPASLANSAGLFRGRQTHFDLVRPGCALYGVNPTPEADNPMRDVVRLEAKVLQVRDVDSPETVGYGGTHQVVGRSKIATIAAGYADGYFRALGNRATAFAAGVALPVVGIVSMDLTTIDITALPEDALAPGDTIQLIGPDVPVDAVAAAADTIGYEVLTSLGRRYHRRYVGTGTAGSPTDERPGESPAPRAAGQAG
ncbi:MAG: alanine racemase [Azospirillaceae bacterium]